MNIASSIQATLVTLVAIIGLVVLIALKDITAAQGLLPITALAGVHLGANVSLPTTTTTTTAPAAPIQ